MLCGSSNGNGGEVGEGEEFGSTLRGGDGGTLGVGDGGLSVVFS